MTPTLSLVIPCYNEAATLEACIDRVLAIASPAHRLEIVVVDDASTDDSLRRARALENRHPEVRVLAHDHNRGKGAALRTGFRHVTGDFVAVQDADLEYDPKDLIELLVPLQAGRADAVLGSRFLRSKGGPVLRFWHSTVNRLLTLLSNAMTDLRLTDVETCYKVFRREVIQAIEIEEDRFGFEPEIVAKLARRRLRLYEIAIDYAGRSHAEGKKIRAVDGLRALYCIVHYNARTAPVAIQLVLHALIGVVAAVTNLVLFGLFTRVGIAIGQAAVVAYGASSLAGFGLCRHFLFPAEATFPARREQVRFAAASTIGTLADLLLSTRLVAAGFDPMTAKGLALLPFPLFTFLVRKQFVFRGEIR